MAEKKRSLFTNRELDYAKDYIISVDGESVYVGVLYAFNGDEAENKAVFRRNAVFSAAIAALMVLCGFIQVSAMTFSPVVTLAYGLGLIAAFLMLVACIRLARSRQPMHRRTFDYSFKRLRWFAPASALLGAVACIGAIVYDLSHREAGFTVTDGIFIAAQAAVTVMAALICLSVYRIEYRMIDPEIRDCPS